MPSAPQLTGDVNSHADKRGCLFLQDLHDTKIKLGAGGGGDGGRAQWDTTSRGLCALSCFLILGSTAARLILDRLTVFTILV